MLNNHLSSNKGQICISSTEANPSNNSFFAHTGILFLYDVRPTFYISIYLHIPVLAMISWIILACSSWTWSPKDSCFSLKRRSSTGTQKTWEKQNGQNWNDSWRSYSLPKCSGVNLNKDWSNYDFHSSK